MYVVEAETLAKPAVPSSICGERRTERHRSVAPSGLRRSSAGGGGGGDDGNTEARLGRFGASIEHIQQDVSELRQDVRELRSEIATVSRELRTEMATTGRELRSEMATM